MSAETITYQISVRFFQGDESDADFEKLKARVLENFKNAKFITDNSAEARIIGIEIIEEENQNEEKTI